jgi:hypothetical protein
MRNRILCIKDFQFYIGVSFVMFKIMGNYIILTTEAEKDYELIDSGEGEKLERYGDVVVARPDPQALWS